MGGDDPCEPESLLVKYLATTQAVEALEAEVVRLRGLEPELPPYPPEGHGLPRYGLRWGGPDSPLPIPMDDGYWTPYHLAVRQMRSMTPPATQQAKDPVAWEAVNKYGIIELFLDEDNAKEWAVEVGKVMPLFYDTPSMSHT